MWPCHSCRPFQYVQPIRSYQGGYPVRWLWNRLSIGINMGFWMVLAGRILWHRRIKQEPAVVNFLKSDEKPYPYHPCYPCYPTFFSTFTLLNTAQSWQPGGKSVRSSWLAKQHAKDVLWLTHQNQGSVNQDGLLSWVHSVCQCWVWNMCFCFNVGPTMSIVWREHGGGTEYTVCLAPVPFQHSRFTIFADCSHFFPRPPNTKCLAKCLETIRNQHFDSVGWQGTWVYI